MKKQGAGSGRSSELVWVMVVAAVLLAAAVVVLNWRSAQMQTEPPQATGPAYGGGTVVGDATAPVTLEVYSDYYCSHCARFAADTLPSLLQGEVAAGQVRLVARQFPILGDPSVAAALGAVCAAEQGRYWEFHDAMYAAAAARGPNAARQDDLADLAARVGLDRDRFATCLQSDTARAAVEQDLRRGLAAGVRGTPSFTLGERLYEGYHSYSEVQAAVRAAQP